MRNISPTDSTANCAESCMECLPSADNNCDSDSQLTVCQFGGSRDSGSCVVLGAKFSSNCKENLVKAPKTILFHTVTTRAFFCNSNNVMWHRNTSELESHGCSKVAYSEEEMENFGFRDVSRAIASRNSGNFSDIAYMEVCFCNTTSCNTVGGHAEIENAKTFVRNVNSGAGKVASLFLLISGCFSSGLLTQRLM